MKLFVGLFLITMLATTQAKASMHFYGSSGDMGVASSFACGTGLTCSKVGSKVNLSSSPTLASTVSITGTAGLDGLLKLASDAATDNGDTWQMKAAASGNAFSLMNNTSGSQVAKLTVSTAGDISVVGSITGDGGDSVSGFLQKQVAATATTITAAQCGSTFYNSGAVVIKLPEASGALGCRLTFITANASNFDVNPDDGDQILVETNAVGDAIRNATLGNSITLQAVDGTNWVVVGILGTWTDIN